MWNELLWIIFPLLLHSLFFLVYLFLLKYTWFTVLLIPIIWQRNSVIICIYPFLIFFSIMVYHRIYFYLEDNCFTVLCYFLLYNSVNQGQVYIYSLPLEPPSHSPPSPRPPLGHHRAQSWAPCALQQLPTSYLFHTLFFNVYFSFYYSLIIL